LLFADGKTILTDLQPVIGAHISEEDLASPGDWGREGVWSPVVDDV